MVGDLNKGKTHFFKEIVLMDSTLCVINKQILEPGTYNEMSNEGIIGCPT